MLSYPFTECVSEIANQDSTKEHRGWQLSRKVKNKERLFFNLFAKNQHTGTPKNRGREQIQKRDQNGTIDKKEIPLS